ncbi:hypothetical protein TNCV_2511241 [Trichonephila clavipes]|nr:hypothetical protein TNCV_2511241 [Trichonephila clavipes]
MRQRLQNKQKKWVNREYGPLSYPYRPRNVISYLKKGSLSVLVAIGPTRSATLFSSPGWFSEGVCELQLPFPERPGHAL